MELRAAYGLAVGLVQRHGLEGWAVDFDGAKRRAGVCRYDRRVIGLSAPLTRLHDESEVRDTILHEIAHALVGAGAGHGPVWQAQARAIGCSASRCVPEDAPRVPGAWLGVCSAGHTIDRHRRPERVILCRPCADRPDVERVYEWTHHGRPAVMHPNYSAELDSLVTGTRTVRYGVGVRVRITAAGDFNGRTGTVIKRGKTRYHVQLDEGVVRVLFASVELAPDGQSGTVILEDEAGGQLAPPQAEPVSLSLLTADGRASAEDVNGRVRELLLPAVQLIELLEADSVVTVPSETDARLERHVFFLIERDQRLIVPHTLDPTAPEDGTYLVARFTLSEREPDDWIGADENIARLLALAKARGRTLLLQSVRSGINLRLEIGPKNGEQVLQIAADRSIDAHDVWRRASRLGDLFVLESPLSKGSLSAAGRLAMVAFGASGDSPLDVFPAFVGPR